MAASCVGRPLAPRLLIIMGEMPQIPKAAGERHLGDRHVRRLLQYLPGVLEPDIFQILHRRFPPPSAEIVKQASGADFGDGGEGLQCQRLIPMRFDIILGNAQLPATDIRPLFSRRLPVKLRIGAEKGDGQCLFHFRNKKSRQCLPSLEFRYQEANKPFEPRRSGRIWRSRRISGKLEPGYPCHRAQFGGQKSRIDPEDQILE